MKPTADVYTIAMPWYEPDDFHQLWELAHDRGEMPADYKTWHQNAIAVMNIWLSRGRALEIVTIRRAELLAWLSQTGLPNTAENRRRYVEQRASHCHDVA